MEICFRDDVDDINPLFIPNDDTAKKTFFSAVEAAFHM